MKKTMIALISMLLIGCTNLQGKVDYIGEAYAKEISTKDAGVNASEVTFEKIELDSKAGVDYYEVEFHLNGVSYDYDIDAYSGKIISKSSEAVNKNQAIKSTDKQPVNQNEKPSGGHVTNSAEYIGEEKAKAIALGHAGLSEAKVTFVEVEWSSDDGRYHYDIEFYAKDMHEYDYEIDAISGEIISYDQDAENYSPQVNSVKNNNAKISVEEAKAIALKQVLGATLKDLVEFEIDYENGKIEYEGKIIFDHLEYEFSIDGYSGSIRSWEVDSIDD